MPDQLTYGLTHLAIAVTDINRTLNFYEKVFGMQVMYHTENFLQLSTVGCNDIMVFEQKPGAQVGNSGGIAHFGFRLVRPEGISVMISRVTGAGGTIIDQGEFVKGSPYVFFKDPDGYEVEVWYEQLESAEKHPS